LKALLNKHLYRSKSEFYDCNLDIIINAISKCLKIEKKCKKCKDMIHQNGGNMIIDELLNYYNHKFNNYKNLYELYN